MGQIKILIIEDEPKVADFIKRGLLEQNYTVEIAFDGLAGKRMALGNQYDLIILDINLPFINGFELCKEIRKIKKSIPIIMLTAMGTTEDKLSGFDAGTDDYLLKPFEFSELLARIKALLKRPEVAFFTNNILTIADLEMDMAMKTVKRNNIEIVLTAKEFALLEFMIRNKGRVVSRAEIAEKIWDLNFDTGTNVIDVYINFLRKKIDINFPVKLIHTKVGMGYYITDKE
jgi:two-component system, OmpR family, copper resistance phosphate regulon response regulator CusR